MRYLLPVLLILFAPIIILLTRSFMGLFFQWLFPGPESVNAILRRKRVNHEWKIGQRSMTSILGGSELQLRLEDLSEERMKYTLMIETRAIFGKVKIIYPPEMSLMIDNKGVLSKLTIPDTTKFTPLNSEVKERPAVSSDERELRIVISSRSLLGSVEIEQKNI